MINHKKGQVVFADIKMNWLKLNYYKTLNHCTLHGLLYEYKEKFNVQIMVLTFQIFH